MAKTRTTDATRLAALAEIELRSRSEQGATGSYADFQKRYYHDPAGFVRDCIRWPQGKQPYSYQLDALQMVQEEERVCLYGPHGLGKTALFSWLIHWFALTRDGQDWKVPSTASAWRQLTKYLWPEVHRWTRYLKWGVIGRRPYQMGVELQQLSLKLNTGEAFTMAASSVQTTEGAHAERLLYLFDEAKVIREEQWDAAEGAFSTGGEVKWVAASTPGDTSGRFWSIASGRFGYADWKVRRVTTGECLAAGAIREEWVRDRREQWSESSQVFQNRVLGSFASGGRDGVIPLAWIEAANERWLVWKDQHYPGRFTGLAADVGGGGEEADLSVIATVYDYSKIRQLRTQPQGEAHTATMQLVGSIIGILDAYGSKYNLGRSLPAIIDSVGIGLGVLHRLVEQGYNAHGFLAGASTGLKDQSGELGFADWRSAMWWLAREMLEPNSGFEVCLPPDEEDSHLTADLIAPRFTHKSDGRIQVESKQRIRARLRRSTDFADAVLMALVGPALLAERAEQGATTIRVYTGEDLQRWP